MTMDSTDDLYTTAPRSCWPHRIMEQLLSASAKILAWRRYCAQTGHHPPKPSVHPKSMTIVGKIHGSGNSEVKVGVAQLTINLSDPLLECMSPVSSELCKVRGPDSLRGDTTTRKHSNNPITF